MTIKNKLRNLVSILVIQLAVGCSPSYICQDGKEAEISERGIEFCSNGHNINPKEIDYHFSNIEDKLNYSNTSTDLFVEISPAKICERQDGTSGYCFEEYSTKYNGYFLSPDFIKIHNGNDTIKLEKTALRFELNRYFKFHHNSPDWNCKEYEKKRKGEPSCFDEYVK